MKILKLVVLLTWVFISCNSDDDNTSNSSALTGVWNQTIEIEAGTDFTDECTGLNTIEFRNDGNGTNVSYGKLTINGISECISDGENEFKWRVEGNRIMSSFIFEGNELESNFIFKIENNILTFDSDQGEDSLISVYQKN